MSLEMKFEGGARKVRFRFRPLRVPVSTDGLFESHSVIRRVYSDSVVLLGANAALLLQLSHPSIAQGVHDHSEFENRPLDRLFGTLFATNAVAFGSREEAERIRTTMANVHSRVTGPGYHALDPDLLCWVNATLAGTALQLYQRLVRPLSAADLDAFVVDSRLVGEIFGCPLESQPGSWSEFERYWDATVNSLVVGDTARLVARSLMTGRGLPLRPVWRPALSVTGAMTAAIMPERLRDEFELPWRRSDQAIAKGVLSMTAKIAPRLPDRWRQLGPELLGSSTAAALGSKPYAMPSENAPPFESRSEHSA